ncbi:transposable element Tcb2 transposase [Trichonephila clavipes]|nr:transposable element Tcb2 transposase [Trichonephila clavipes]
MSRRTLTFSEIFSKTKSLIQELWKTPPTHPWYNRQAPGGSLSIKVDRVSKQLLATPDHLLFCAGLDREDIYSSPLLVIFQTPVKEGEKGSPKTGRSRKLAYQLNEEAERTERPIRRLSKVMYGSTCADMPVDVMGECLSGIKHVVGARRNRRRQREKSQDTRQRRLDDRYRVFTVARRLHGGGLFARRPVRCVPLTPAHRRRRSLWCREHRNWRDNEWGRVLFTDGSRFSLSSDSHHILVWREREAAIIPRTSLKGTGSVNGTRYGNEILLPYVRLFRGAMGLQFLFMDDNAPCHRTVAAEQLLESEDIERMDFPYDLGSQSHRACMGFSRQTLDSSYLTTSNDSAASIGAARRIGSNASTTH